MEIEDGEIVEDGNEAKVQVASDSRKRISEGGQDDSVAMKRMAVATENGAELNEDLSTPDNSVDTAALQERVKKLERLYQRACRTTRETEIRAERAEKTIEVMKAVGTAGASEEQAVVKQEISVNNAESNNNQPVDNSAEMTALHEKVKKLERMFEGACRTAREAELRAECLEKIIDTKQGIKESVDKKDKEIEELRNNIVEMGKKLVESTRLNDLNRGSKEREEQLRRDNDGMRRELDHMRGIINSMVCPSCHMGQARQAGPMQWSEAGLMQENEAMRWEIANMRRFIDNGCQNCGMLGQQIEAMKWEIFNLNKRSEPAKNDCQNCGVLGKRINGLSGKCTNCPALDRKITALNGQLTEANKKCDNNKKCPHCPGQNRKINELSAKLAEATKKCNNKKCVNCDRLNAEIKNLKKNFSAESNKKDCPKCAVLRKRNTDLNRTISELDKKLAENNKDPSVEVIEQEDTTGNSQEPAKEERAAKSVACTNILLEPEQKKPVVYRSTDEILADLATIESSGNFDDIWTPYATGDFVDCQAASKVLKYKYTHECNQPAFLKMIKDDMIRCCGKLFIKSKFILHFCSNRHKKQVKKRGNRVSKAALATWIDAMEASRSAGDATIEEAPSDESIQWIEAEESGTADAAAVESFQMKRKREEAPARRLSRRIQAMEEKAVDREGEEGGGERDAEEQVGKTSNRGRSRGRGRVPRARGGDGEQGDETAENVPVDDDEVLVIEAMEENETSKDATIEDEEALRIEAMEENETAEGPLGYDASVIEEESGVAEDATIEDEEALPIEAMEESGTAEDAPVEDEYEPEPLEEPANGGGEGQEEETDERAVVPPAENNGGFFSWLLGAFSQPVNGGEKERRESQSGDGELEIKEEDEEDEDKGGEEEEEKGREEEEMDEGRGAREHARVTGKRRRSTSTRSLDEESGEHSGVMGKRGRLTPMESSLMKDREDNEKRWTNRREMVAKMIGPHMKKVFDK